MSEICLKNCPKVIEQVMQKVLILLENPYDGYIAIMGSNSTNPLYPFQGLGRSRIAKYVTKKALELDPPFEQVIWISMQQERDWKPTRVQMIIMQKLGILDPKVGDLAEEMEWDEKAAAEKIFIILRYQKFLLVMEDPPAKDFRASAIGVPPPYNGSKILTVTTSRDVCTAMRTDKDVVLDLHNQNDFWQLIREECLDLADSPSFRGHLTHLHIRGCFLRFAFFCAYANLGENLMSSLIYYWFGEGYIGSQSTSTEIDQLDIIAKLKLGQDLFTEFRKRCMMTTPLKPKYGIPVLQHNFYFVTDWTGKEESLQLKGNHICIYFAKSGIHKLCHPPQCPKVSTLVIRDCLKLKELPDDMFKYMEGLRVLDLSSTAISSLPSHTTFLTQKLRVLMLRNCRYLSIFPSSIQALENLEILDISGTLISSSSFSVEHLCKLRILDISNNINITSFPSSICNLINLEQLDLSDLRTLSQIPDTSFQNMHKLVSLNLSNATSLQSLPASISCCTNLKHLILKDCSSLKSVVSDLHHLQASLVSLNLSGCTALKDIQDASGSYGSIVLPRLHSLDMSRNTQIFHLSLRGCPNLEVVNLTGLSNLRVLDISSTKIKRFPSEVCSEENNVFRCLYALGTEFLSQVDWDQIKQPPRHTLFWDQCSSSYQLLEDENVHRVFISIADSRKTFNSLNENPTLFGKFQRFQVYVSPCSDRGNKGKYTLFQKKQFPYEDMYLKYTSPSCIPTITPSIHFSVINKTKDRVLEINGGKSYPKFLDSVLCWTQFFFLRNNKLLVNLSDLGTDNMRQIKECWTEKCNGLETIFKTNAKERYYVAENLQSLWVYNLLRLSTVCRGPFRGLDFGKLQHMRLEYCPNLVNAFSSGGKGITLRKLKALEIRFCGRLEEVFAEGTIVSGEDGWLPELHMLCLWDLYSLRSIISSNVHFPSLKKLRVRGCPKLTKLPIDLSNGKGNVGKLEIEGELKWWNNLQWEDNEKVNKNDHINFMKLDEHFTLQNNPQKIEHHPAL